MKITWRRNETDLPLEVSLSYGVQVCLLFQFDVDIFRFAMLKNYAHFWSSNLGLKALHENLASLLHSSIAISF